MELYQASQQWAERPEDEKFQTLDAMYDATKRYAEQAQEKAVPWTDLRVEANGTELTMVGKAGIPAVPTHYAFGQLAQHVGAPAGYLRSLPATLAAQNLNHGFKQKNGGSANLLFHQNGGLVLRAATTEHYARIWDYEVIGRVRDLCARYGMVPARQTMKWDGTVMTQAEIDAAPRSLYASDHDCFMFTMSEQRDITDPVGKTMHRGVIVTNSEVGDRSLGIMGFWFRDVCQNHIIWGAENLATVRLVHRGAIRDRWIDAQVTVRRYLDSDTSFEKARFEEVTRQIAGTKDEVLESLFNRKALRLSKATLEASYNAVKPEQDGDPRTVWGFAQGITRHAQTVPYADDRHELDRAAGRLLEFKF